MSAYVAADRVLYNGAVQSRRSANLFPDWVSSPDRRQCVVLSAVNDTNYPGAYSISRDGASRAASRE
jgi:hypothetical protein